MTTPAKDKKRKTSTGDEAEPSRKRSTGLSKLYHAEEIKEAEESWKKGVVIKKYFRIKFSPRIEQIPNPDEVYGEIVIDLISKAAPSFLGHGEIRAGITLNNEKLYRPYGINLTPLQQLSRFAFVSELKNLRQSNSDIPPLARCEFDATITYVRSLSGSGREDSNRTALSGNGRRNRAVTPVNVSKDCLPVAIAVAIAYEKFKKDKKKFTGLWKQAQNYTDDNKKSRKIRNMVYHLKKQTGLIGRTSYGVHELKLFQHLLEKDYRILVFFDEYRKELLYEGPRKYHVPELYLSYTVKEDGSGHFDHIKAIGAFIGTTKYFCTRCKASFNTKELHFNCPDRCRKCQGPAHLCASAAILSEISRIHCSKCRIYFPSELCYANHLKKGKSNGKSQCDYSVYCSDCDTTYFTMHGGEHSCGQHNCKRCRKLQPTDHICLMSRVKKIEKRISRVRIYYDFETISKKGMHNVILAVALKSCQECDHFMPGISDNLETLVCSNCSPKGRLHKFTNLDGPGSVISRFCRWLFSKENRNSVAIAHNAKGFDAQFILRELLTGKYPCPEVVQNGRKIICLSMNNVKLIDSLSYFSCPLSAFSKTFDLPMEKGYFPHLFVREENFDYVGGLPDDSYYDMEYLPAAKKTEMQTWLHEQRSNNFLFNFQKEFMKYCIQDVLLLAAAMTKFEKAFEELTNVVLFAETCTSASAAVLAFRRNFLDESIPIQLDIGGQGGVNYSRLSQKYLLWRQQKDGTSIQMAVNKGEKKVEGFRVDGFIQRGLSSGQGHIIEVHGCHWHAHDCMYKKEDEVRKGVTAHDIRTSDEIRLNALRKEYSVEVVYECDIKKLCSTNKEVQEYFEETPVYNAFSMSDSLTGGRTEVFNLLSFLTPGMKFHYKDVVSLYPMVMKWDEFPVGVGEMLNGYDIEVPISEPERLLHKGFYHARVLPPRRLELPVLPHSMNGKLLFVLCRACGLSAATSKVGLCTHTDEERSLVGTWSTFELSVALEKGYIIEQVFSGIHWTVWTKYSNNKRPNTSNKGIFAGFVNSLLVKKIEASGWESEITAKQKQEFLEEIHIREGIQPDPALMKKNPALRAATKLLLNSLWGKFAQRIDTTKLKITDELRKLEEIVNNTSSIVRSVDIYGDKVCIAYSVAEHEQEPFDFSAKHIASLTTSHARIRLYRFLDKLKPCDLLYCDTDSVFYKASIDFDPLEEFCSPHLGDLTNELCGEVQWFTSTGPKSYAYVERIDGEDIEKVKVKGFAKTSEFENKLTALALKRQALGLITNTAVDCEELETPCFKICKDHTIVREVSVKKFQATFNKRIINSDGTTLPLGYCLQP